MARTSPEPLVGKALRAAYYSMIEGFGLVGFVNNNFRYPCEHLGRYRLRRRVRDPELWDRGDGACQLGSRQALRRLQVSSATAGGTAPPEHDNASIQVSPLTDGRCTVTWTHDVLPAEFAPDWGRNMELVLDLFQKTLEGAQGISI